LAPPLNITAWIPSIPVRTVDRFGSVTYVFVIRYGPLATVSTGRQIRLLASTGCAAEVVASRSGQPDLGS
jgi:hypothetical protein